jgi:Kdo2-lipid IVA lauroyltransferase/acyltransferase
MQTLKHIIEYALLRLLFAGFRALPLDIASFSGGFIARAIGPYMRAHRIAKDNLVMIFPDIKPQEHTTLLKAMWDNLGRVSAELVHLPQDELYNRMEIYGLENVPVDKKTAIYFSGHIGNWELCYPIAHHNGTPITLIYREANNPFVDAYINSIRHTQANAMLPKGPKGIARMLRAIKDGQSLAMLVDQKMNDGIAVPFFGRDAMTAPAIATLALRYDLPIIPVRVVRTKGVHFKANVYPPLVFKKTGDDEKDTLAIMMQVNTLLESWIRETPEQWFWVHKRWPNA